VNSDRYAQLVEALRERALGNCPDTAAVELIAGHGLWLHRPDFGRFIARNGHCCATGEPIAAIRWRAAITALNQGHLPCSGGEADLLRIAAAIGAGIPVRLRGVLGNLDHRTIALVTTAIAAANGTSHFASRTSNDF
jgi:hypothetical protein